MNIRCAMTVALLASAAAHAEVTGVVSEILNPEAPRAEWRRQPLANVYVTMTWDITIPAPAHATSWCRHSEIARSNEKGEYAMEGPSWLTRAIGHLAVGVYARGYELVYHPYDRLLESGKEIPMAKSTLPAEKRIERLHELSGCEGMGQGIHDPKRLVHEYYRNVAEEAKSLNVQSQYGRNVTQSLEAMAQRTAPGYREPGSEPLRAVIIQQKGALQAAPAQPQ